MKCFYHHDRDAVGTCKSCQRGVCPECAVEFPHGLACKARCENDVESLIRLIQNNVKFAPANIRLIRAQRSGGLLAAGFYLVTGAVFVGGGLYERFTMIAVFGGCFLAFGVLTFIRVLRLTANDPKLES